MHSLTCQCSSGCATVKIKILNGSEKLSKNEAIWITMLRFISLMLEKYEEKFASVGIDLKTVIRKASWYFQ